MSSDLIPVANRVIYSRFGLRGRSDCERSFTQGSHSVAHVVASCACLIICRRGSDVPGESVASNVVAGLTSVLAREYLVSIAVATSFEVTLCGCSDCDHGGSYSQCQSDAPTTPLVRLFTSRISSSVGFADSGYRS